MLVKKNKAEDLLQAADTAENTGKRTKAEQGAPSKSRRADNEMPKETTPKRYTGIIRPSHEGMIW